MLNIVAIKKGQMTDEHKEAIRKSVSHPLTEEHKQKIRDAWEERGLKQQVSERNLKYWEDHYDEIVEKMREAVENWKKHKNLPSEADDYRAYQREYHRLIWYPMHKQEVARQRQRNRRKRR